MKKFGTKMVALGMAVMMAVMMTACGAGNGGNTASDGVVKAIDISLTDELYAFGVDKNNDELLTKTNEYIASIKSDGTLDEICEHYFGDGTPVGVTSAELNTNGDTEKEQLVVATNAEFSPFEYISSGR